MTRARQTGLAQPMKVVLTRTLNAKHLLLTENASPTLNGCLKIAPPVASTVPKIIGRFCRELSCSTVLSLLSKPWLCSRVRSVHRLYGSVQQLLHGTSAFPATPSKVVELLRSTKEYMENLDIKEELREICKNEHEMCAAWVLKGECTANPTCKLKGYRSELIIWTYSMQLCTLFRFQRHEKKLCSCLQVVWLFVDRGTMSYRPKCTKSMGGGRLG